MKKAIIFDVYGTLISTGKCSFLSMTLANPQAIAKKVDSSYSIRNGKNFTNNK